MAIVCYYNLQLSETLNVKLKETRSCSTTRPPPRTDLVRHSFGLSTDMDEEDGGQ